MRWSARAWSSHPGSLVAGVPAKVVGRLGDDLGARLALGVRTYEQLREEHRAANAAAASAEATSEAESAG